MKQSLFENRHQSDWEAFAGQLDALERGKAEAQACTRFAADYRQLCQHLALAQARGYSSHLIDQLQQLAMRGHQQFYRHRSHLGAQIIRFLFGGFPRLVRSEWRSVCVASLLFFGSLGLMGLLTYLYPELIYSLVSPDQVSNMEHMYDPDARRLGRFSERGSGDDWMMFGFYIMNNIGIAFQTFASGLRNPVGIAFYPGSDRLFTVVNERDGLGDGLVPDYLTGVAQDDFYGWPYAYSGSNPQPGFAEKRPDLVAASKIPDLMFEAHSAPIGLTFYTGDQFPDRYQGGAFVTLRGSWNKATPTGYKVVFVPFSGGQPTGSYETFASGWWQSGDQRARVWGRPTGIAVATDGSLLVSDDTGGEIWQIRYTGE